MPIFPNSLPTRSKVECVQFRVLPGLGITLLGSTHSADANYLELMPKLSQRKSGNPDHLWRDPLVLWLFELWLYEAALFVVDISTQANLQYLLECKTEMYSLTLLACAVICWGICNCLKEACMKLTDIVVESQKFVVDRRPCFYSRNRFLVGCDARDSRLCRRWC